MHQWYWIDFSKLSVQSVAILAQARRVILTCWCQGASALSLYWRQGASAFPLAMCALLCWCALALGVALGSLQDNEPMQADESPIIRGDAPRGLFTPRGKKCSRSMGLNVLGGQEVRFSSTGCHRIMVSSTSHRGIGWWPRLTPYPFGSSFGSSPLAQALAQGRLGSNPRGQIVCRNV